MWGNWNTYTWLEGIRRDVAILKSSNSFLLKNFNTESPCDLAMQLHGNWEYNMSTERLTKNIQWIIHNSQKCINNPNIHQLTSKQSVLQHTMRYYYSAIKRGKVQIHTTARTNPENISHAKEDSAEGRIMFDSVYEKSTVSKIHGNQKQISGCPGGGNRTGSSKSQ